MTTPKLSLREIISYIVGLLSLIAIIFHFIITFWPLPVDGEHVINVVSGDNITTIRKKMIANGVLARDHFLSSAFVFKFYNKINSFDKKIHVGEYDIKAGISLVKLFKQINTGNVKQYSITFVEGWNLHQILKALALHPKVNHKLADNAKIKLKDFAINNKEYDYRLEGRFLPETYYFVKNTTDIAILERANQALEKKLINLWESRSKDCILKNKEEALILASIIEKETALKHEMPQISGVYQKRLKLGMKLQADPTVAYGLEQKSNFNMKIFRLRRKHLKLDTAYNTYLYKGLPKGAIAIPSVEAITAALKPDLNNNLYFVANKDGGHSFSSNFVGHLENINKN